MLILILPLTREQTKVNSFTNDSNTKLEDYAVTSTLRLESSVSNAGDAFYVSDCQWIRSRQYLELLSEKHNASKIVTVRYCFQSMGKNYVVATYKHGNQFEIVALMDISGNPGTTYLRTLYEGELDLISSEIISHENDLLDDLLKNLILPVR
jgi:hypothetical protein